MNYYYLIVPIIIVVIFLYFRSSKKRALRSKVLRDTNSSIEKVSFENMVDGFSKGKKLYKDLITKAHPDRFLDDESKNLANDLSSRITKSKLNYQELKELEVEVREFLAKAN